MCFYPKSKTQSIHGETESVKTLSLFCLLKFLFNFNSFLISMRYHRTSNSRYPTPHMLSLKLETIQICHKESLQ